MSRSDLFRIPFCQAFAFDVVFSLIVYRFTTFSALIHFEIHITLRETRRSIQLTGNFGSGQLAIAAHSKASVHRRRETCNWRGMYNVTYRLVKLSQKAEGGKSKETAREKKKKSRNARAPQADKQRSTAERKRRTQMFRRSDEERGRRAGRRERGRDATEELE